MKNAPDDFSDAIQSLVDKGLMEAYTNNGKVCYRLTSDGNAVARHMDSNPSTRNQIMILTEFEQKRSEIYNNLPDLSVKEILSLPTKTRLVNENGTLVALIIANKHPTMHHAVMRVAYLIDSSDKSLSTQYITTSNDRWKKF